MFNKSIAYKLSIYISLAVIGVFLIFITASYFFNQNLLSNNIKNKAIAMSNEINGIVNKNTTITRDVAMNISEQIIYYSRNNDSELILRMVMEKYPMLNAIHISLDSSLAIQNSYYFIGREGSKINYEQGNSLIYNCTNEIDILKQVNKLKSAGWTDAYRCDSENDVVVAFYCPVFDDEKQIVGQVYCELSLSELNKNINQMGIGERGFAFIVNRNGDYITHPIKEWILARNLNELPNKIVKRRKIDIDSILEGKQSGSAVVYPEILNYEKSWVYYTPTNENRWFLIFIMPYNELFNELYIQTLRMLFFAVIGIIIIYFIISYISNKLIEPLSSVTTQLNKLSHPGGKESSKNEVKQVADSLNSLKTWFEKYRTNQEQEELKNYRRRQDLIQASEIQQSLIKTDFSTFAEGNNIDLYAFYKPARVVSGDLFDYFFIDEDNLAITVGDVSGKGVPAAIFMSIAQTIIKNNALFKRAKTIVNKANQDLCTDNTHQFFLTLFLGILNVKKGEFNYCNAAHTISLILKPDGSIIELNQTHGLPLGLYIDRNYKDSKIKLDEGDKLILYTDGVSELLNEDKTQFGIERLKETLEQYKDLGPEDLVMQIEKSLEFYRGNTPQSDDICVFVIEYTP
jgi:sigma-B regulation protein RsbU (phosphoserine phosphatase)